MTLLCDPFQGGSGDWKDPQSYRGTNVTTARVGTQAVFRARTINTPKKERPPFALLKTCSRSIAVSAERAQALLTIVVANVLPSPGWPIMSGRRPAVGHERPPQPGYQELLRRGKSAASAAPAPNSRKLNGSDPGPLHSDRATSD